MSADPNATPNPLPDEPEPVNPDDMNQDGTTASEGGGPGIGYGGTPPVHPAKGNQRSERETPDKSEPHVNREI